MVAEIYASLGAVKAAFDIAKGLKDINDGAIRNTAIIELQEKILSAQIAQSTLIDRIRELEKEVADFETWDAKKDKYELKSVPRGGFAYMLKPDARGAEPPHWLCTHCFEGRKRSIMQRLPSHATRDNIFKCPACPASFLAYGSPAWLDDTAT
jgi:hypothetical protein